MKKTIVVNLLLNTVGAFLYTVAINGFLISNHLGEGGVTGLMTIFYYLLKIAPSLTNIVLNGLLLLIGWKLLNKPRPKEYALCAARACIKSSWV